MQFKVYNKDTAIVESVYFKLTEDNGVINLIACDEAGDRIQGGNILAIGGRGVYFYPGVSAKLGLPLSPDSRVEIYSPFPSPPAEFPPAEKTL